MALSPREKADRLFGAGPVAICWLNLASAEIAEIAAESGYTACVIDLEHSVISLETAEHQMMAMKGSSMVPMVRIAERSAGLTKRVLDAGAAGLFLPYVESVEEAQNAVLDLRYGPHGRRGLANYVVRAARYGFDPENYVSRWDECGLLIIMIESRMGLGASRAIAEIDGVDGLFFGPSDYSFDLGRTKLVGPEVALGFKSMHDAARAAGKLVGSAPFGDMTAQRLVEMGCDLIAAASDVGALRTGFRAALASARGDSGS